MTTSNFQIGQEVTFNGAFGVNVIIEIKGNTATTLEKNSGLTYKKRLSSLKAYKQQTAYWNEQELVNPVYNHGDVIFSSISADGNGYKLVWDSIKNTSVTENNLTKI